MLNKPSTQNARNARDNDAIKRTITEYDDALEAYIPGESLLVARTNYIFIYVGLLVCVIPFH